MIPPATRAEGLRLLRDFTPRMGAHYAKGRNFDHGPGRHHAVSQLSPFLRRRLVLEAEVIAAAIDAHGLQGAEKFIQEVVWRGYFKGWLEWRPQVWTHYRDGIADDLAIIAIDRGLRRRIEEAQSGATGLDCFDAWVTELRETGYLHNHARMWFASIWIFTFELPWRLGADFMYRHLLDGDPASNTLSWRWVAGLHTRGKAYAALAENIATYTGGRFLPRGDTLNEDIAPLDGSEPDGLPTLQPLRTVTAPLAGVPTALLITEDDCNISSFPIATLDIRAAATLQSSHLRAIGPTSDLVQKFEAQALSDAAQRAGVAATQLHASNFVDLAAWAKSAGAVQIITPYVPRGPVHDWMAQAMPALARAGITFCEWRRDWDSTIWPHATAGFFKVKQKIPQILAQVEIAGSDKR